MIPLELRSNKLISIMIRAFDLEYTNYKLEVIASNNTSIISKETLKTIVKKLLKKMPKFEIDRNQNDLSKYLLSSSNSIFKFILKKQEENIDEFIVDMSELVFFASDLANSKITKYPIIIFEFTEGFFLPKTHYEVNFIYIEKSIKQEMRKQSAYPSSIKKEASFMALDKKFKEFDFFQRQNSINFEKKTEKINAFNDSITEKLALMDKHTTNYEMMRNIDKMRKEIYYLEENINNNSNLIEILKKNIFQKQNDVQLCTSILNMCKDNYNEKKNNLESEKKSIEKCKFRKESIKLRKFSDFSFIFFNHKCINLYSIPVGFEIMFTKNSEDKIKFLERYNKDLSIMFGEIAIMVNHLAKLYDISLKYPLFINGSRSYILFGKEEFIPLYFVLKFGEKNMKFDLAISLLHSNLNQILLYFNICSYKELKLFNIFSIFIRFYQYLQGVFTMNSFGQSKKFLDNTIAELDINLCF